VKIFWCFNKVPENKGFSNNVYKEKNSLYTIKRSKAKWIVHLRGNCLLKYITKGKIDGRSYGNRRKKT
jgi:hypothetical protein